MLICLVFALYSTSLFWKKGVSGLSNRFLCKSKVVIYVAEVWFFKHFQQTERSSFCAMCGLFLLAKGFLAAPRMVNRWTVEPEFLEFLKHSLLNCFWRGFIRWWLIRHSFVSMYPSTCSFLPKGLREGKACHWLSCTLQLTFKFTC